MTLGAARLALALVFAVALFTPTVSAAAGPRHSGTVVGVESGAGRLVVEEMLQGTRTQKLTVRVGPGTKVLLSERLPDAEVRDPTHPFSDRPIALADIRAGDAVTVELPGAGQPASAVTVTLRAGAR